MKCIGHFTFIIMLLFFTITSKASSADCDRLLRGSIDLSGLQESDFHKVRLYSELYELLKKTSAEQRLEIRHKFLTKKVNKAIQALKEHLNTNSYPRDKVAVVTHLIDRAVSNYLSGNLEASMESSIGVGHMVASAFQFLHKPENYYSDGFFYFISDGNHVTKRHEDDFFWDKSRKSRDGIFLKAGYNNMLSFPDTKSRSTEEIMLFFAFGLSPRGLVAENTRVDSELMSPTGFYIHDIEHEEVYVAKLYDMALKQEYADKVKIMDQTSRDNIFTSNEVKFFFERLQALVVQLLKINTSDRRVAFHALFIIGHDIITPLIDSLTQDTTSLAAEKLSQFIKTYPNEYLQKLLENPHHLQGPLTPGKEWGEFLRGLQVLEENIRSI